VGLQKNVASQKWIVFAWTIATNVALAGDAAQITANLRLDGGAANAIDDTNPTELEDGYYAFDLTDAETNADNIVICPVSSTSGVAVIGCPMACWTDRLVAVETKLDTVDTVADGIQTDLSNVTDGLGALKALLDAIPTTAMRGTDSAALASSWTSALATALGVLKDDWLNGGRLDLILDAAGGAGDPWSTAIPGAYAAGTAGKKIGDLYQAFTGNWEITSNQLILYDTDGTTALYTFNLTRDGEATEFNPKKRELV